MAKSKKPTEELDKPPEELLHSFLDQNQEHHYNYQTSVDYKVSTGSLLLDLETGGGLGPGVHRFVGAANSGKTSEALEVIRNFFNTVEKSRAIYVKAEGRLSPAVQKRSGLSFTTNDQEWTDHTVFIFECNVYETIVNLIRYIITNSSDIRYCIIIDSLDGVILTTDLEKKAEDSVKISGPQTISKKFMQMTNLLIQKFGHIVILVSQVSADININPYEKKPPRFGNFSGGNALLHFAEYIFEFHMPYQTNIILDNPNGKINDGTSKMLGRWCKLTIKKSDQENIFKTVEYPVKYGQTGGSIWRSREIGDLLLSTFAQRNKAWITFDTEIVSEATKQGLEIPEKLQGLESLYSLIESDPKVANFFLAKLKNLLVL